MSHPAGDPDPLGEPAGVIYDRVDDLPDHARLVYAALEEHGEMTLSELADELDKSQGALSNSLHRLRIAGCLDDRPDPTDPRRLKYSLRVESDE